MFIISHVELYQHYNNDTDLFATATSASAAATPSISAKEGQASSSWNRRKKEVQRPYAKPMEHPTYDAIDHARSSSSRYPYHSKSKTEAHKEFTKTSVIKANLNNICEDANIILEIQKIVSHITQVIYAGSMLATYFYLNQVKNKQVIAAITPNLIYPLFSFFFIGQGKKANEKVRDCFDKHCEFLPEQIDLDEFKGQEYETIVSPIAK
ncbi:hypothetical protein G6F55_012300 [Rhizopus delemar]|uniref:Uncharacterized protein n=1 Tax=Rhizopus oryzae TaxID=64495 RepID=A0A9P6XW46_RHIOR|nr:hypothetical protein G6F55_012300 [Rhizopus delemar]KAG1507238.1 hypothetical protein G6F52_011682 [Rhizopus delemar]KAG1533466.1 hypothetical protein G6F51_012599 [Rhizopus arrhizus]KAG1582776.1 hypothetical protein G6F47_012139 [Rhizopus delemar]